MCPVVNASSTPSGHYFQPVNLARDLTLYTSNLPPPVSYRQAYCKFGMHGSTIQVDRFQYECSINGLTLQANLSVSRDLVSCLVPEGVSEFPFLFSLVLSFLFRKFKYVLVKRQFLWSWFGPTEQYLILSMEIQATSCVS